MMRMSPRRWFWMLNLAAAVSIVLSARAPVVVHRPREFVSQMVKSALVPVAWTFSWAQVSLNRVLHPQPDITSRVTALRQRYQNEIAMLEQRVSLLEHIVHESHLITRDFPGLASAERRIANIDGFSTGSVDFCTLDQGYRDDPRITVGDAVLAQRALIGRVVSVGPETCTVRLLTDPRMKEIAAIVRPAAGGQISIDPECFVSGRGNGLMRCRPNESLGYSPPRPGDLILLNDTDWPAAVNGAVIGVITGVHQSPRTALRWRLRIAPRVDVQQVHHVWIVLTARR